MYFFLAAGLSKMLSRLPITKDIKRTRDVTTKTVRILFSVLPSTPVLQKSQNKVIVSNCNAVTILSLLLVTL